MNIALTTRWNASNHQDGEAMIEEILNLGFTSVELGYDLRPDLVPGVLSMVEQKAVTVGTVHNFCPVPMGTSRGHPEIYTFADKDSRIRDLAVRNTLKTLDFAEQVGADTVVSHSGNVDMKRFSYELIQLMEEGKKFTPAFDKKKLKLEFKRDKKCVKQFGYLKESLEKLLPEVESKGLKLALENLPTWEAFPTEQEILELCETYGQYGLRYWHDMGHGQIRQNMGMILLSPWLNRLLPFMAGMHVHDVSPPARDHVMPPHGGMVDFSMYKPIAEQVQHLVIEPPPNAPEKAVRGALEFLNESWGKTASEHSEEKEKE